MTLIASCHKLMDLTIKQRWGYDVLMELLFKSAYNNENVRDAYG